MPEILFHGAAGEVTGSMHMIRVDGRWIALDCGLFQGHRAESEAKNRAWPVHPREISAVVVSHAHTDHTGRLPMLVRDGFEGTIFCTPATRDLCAIMLPDSAHIQVEDIGYLNKRRARKHLPPVEPLYLPADAVAALKQMQTVANDHWFQPAPGVMARFNEAGHMLGSAGIELSFAKRENNHAPTLYFTGDVGRPEAPILYDPAPLPPANVIISESTYGGRINENGGNARAILVETARRTIGRGGKLIMPAFAVGRTQTMVYYLHEEFLAGSLPRVPVFVDSPLAYDATQVFRMHPELYDADATKLLNHTGDLLGTSCLTYVRDVEESKALNERRDPCIIISSSGMCEAGRIRHHLKNNISDARNTILMPGYQAEGTLGRKLVDGAREITLFHEDFGVRADIVQINGFSGHADQQELLSLLRPTPNDPRKVYLVHGEQEQSAALAAKLHEGGLRDVVIASRGLHVQF